MSSSQLIKHPLGFLTVANKPSAEELGKYYAEKYFQQAHGSYELNYGEDEKNYFRAKLAQRYSVIQQLVPNGRKMLDVGCGEGFALAYFRQQGWQVRGLDFSSAGVEAQNPSCIDALETGDVFALLDQENKESRTYDVIILQNVLEHVIDPVDLLGSLKSVVSRGGVLVVTVPNDFSGIQKEALSSGHIDNEFWVALPDHLSYFDHASLPAAAEHAGWKCRELLADFPIDWFLFHEGSNYVNERHLGKAAHIARVQLENLIHRCSLPDVVAYWAAAARLGIGRGITAFLQNE
jgi:2-polyprenyl-3-methyl-5-hydroxy-6-metoxy-1,4-benzoquinol methylase